MDWKKHAEVKTPIVAAEKGTLDNINAGKFLEAEFRKVSGCTQFLQ